MSKKNLYSLIAILVLVSFVLGACTASDNEDPAPTDAPAPTEASAKVWTYADMTVGFLQTGSEGGWRAANTASFKETAVQLGINLKFYDSQK